MLAQRFRALVQALTPLCSSHPGSLSTSISSSQNHVPTPTNSTTTTARLLHTVVSPDSPHRLLIIQPEHRSGAVSHPYIPAECKLEEAEALVHSIEGWEVPHKRVDGIRKIHNQTFFGTGKTAELRSVVRRLGEELTGVFINTPTLTPTQHRTLEQVFQTDVFDRFGIVLRIFKERAQTKEAKVQVELAEIPYAYNKLFGDVEEGGRGRVEIAGETPMASRKFAMKRRLKHLQEELLEIRAKRRHLRESRSKRSATPTVAVVGYTNAGKTTLIKALSQDVSMTPKDMLFATLDSTLHAGKLPCGLPVLYVDTIGFISDLPVELVESFAATLEDSIAADILVHVVDGSHPQAYAQRANVVGVLERLELRPHMLDNAINMVNKIDKVERTSLSEGKESQISRRTQGEEEGGGADVLVSATCGSGLTELEMRVQREVLRATQRTFWIVELPTCGPHLSWLYSSDVIISQVQAAETEEERLTVWVVFSAQTLSKFLSKFSGDNITMTPCHDHNFTMRAN